MSDGFQPDFTAANPYEGMPASYAAQVAAVYVPTAANPQNPVQVAAAEGYLPPIYTTYVPDYSGLWGPVIEAIDNFQITIYQWFRSVVDWVVAALSPLFNALQQGLEDAKTWIVGNISAIITYLLTWLESAIASVNSWISTSVNQVWSWLQSTAVQITTALSSFSSQIWDWINTGITSISQTISSLLGTILASMQSLGTFVAAKVAEINAWFSNEFIDPFLDWLLQFPGKLSDALLSLINGLATRLESWLTHQSPGFPGIIATWIQEASDWCYNNLAFFVPGSPVYKGESAAIWTLAGAGLASMFAELFVVLGPALDAVGGTIGGWLTWIGGRIGGWIVAMWPLVRGWLSSSLAEWFGMPLFSGASLGFWGNLILSRLAGWFTSNIITLLGSGAILSLDATGKLESIVDQFVTPAIVSVFDNFEAMGTVSPVSGKGRATSIGKMATFTVAGLAGMTLAGEMLSPLKQIGLGNISAIIYDLINYKTLTAAFMGVLAFVYIRRPLEYYYNSVARPALPNEMELRQLYADQEISAGNYASYMQYHGYPDNWIGHMQNTSYRPLSAFLLSSLVTAGVMADVDLDKMVRLQGYGPDVGKVIKSYATRSTTAAAKAMSSSTAVANYKVGLDDEADLRGNLAILGYDKAESDRLVVSANLEYTSYLRNDALNYYIDAYHRRDIEEPELRSDLAALGVVSDRIGIIVVAQSIKRLAAAKPVADPAIAIEEATTRSRREKQLISREQEIEQLVVLGDELPYATALADQDDVKLAPSGKPVATPTLLAYETDAGKIQVDTIRRSTRARQMSAADELTALIALAMPASLAQAIVDNDALRLAKATTTA